MTTSIQYDDTIIEGLREQLADALQMGNTATEAATKNRKAAATWRARARQYEALLAHAEGRQDAQKEIALDVARADAHRRALEVAMELLDAGLPAVGSCDIDFNGRLKLYVPNAGLDREQAIASLRQWADHLGAELTSERRGDSRRYWEVVATYGGVPVEVWDIIHDPKPEPAASKDETDEAGAVAR